MIEDNRIPEIRAALGIYYDVDADAPSTAETERDDAVKALDRIRAILGDEPPADGSRPTLGEAYFGALQKLDEMVGKTPAPRVFLPDDEVPVGTVLMAKEGSPFRVPDAYTSAGLARVGVPFVEVLVPSPEEWQAAVDRASEERAGRLAEGGNP